MLIDGTIDTVELDVDNYKSAMAYWARIDPDNDEDDVNFIEYSFDNKFILINVKNGRTTYSKTSHINRYKHIDEIELNEDYE